MGSTTITGSGAAGSSLAYATVAQLKTYLGYGTTTTDDTLLSNIIDRACKWIDARTGRTFKATADSTRYFDAVADVDGRTLTLDGDLCAITAVVNGDSSTISAADYVTEPRNITPYWGITIKTSSSINWTYSTAPENAISVTGRWAFSTTPPDDIVHATIRMAAWIYRQKDAQTFDTLAEPAAGVITVPQGMPRDVAQILDRPPYKRGLGDI